MKKIVLLIVLLIILGTLLVSRHVTHKYREDIFYCKKDSDCGFSVTDDACGRPVNKYNKNAEIPHGPIYFEIGCPPEEIYHYFCNEHSKCDRRGKTAEERSSEQ